MKSHPRLWVKICGVTSPEDAELVVLAGADALGLNFVEGSPRKLERSVARLIADACRGRIELVGVVANQDPVHVVALQADLGLDWLQLHGDEPPEVLASIPRAFKAVGIASSADVSRAGRYPGERLLVDARTPERFGGSGSAFDWELVRELSRSRALILAGGLHPDNVAQAVLALAPFGVDVASGVELPGVPRKKDEERLLRFVKRARAAALDRAPGVG